MRTCRASTCTSSTINLRQPYRSFKEELRAQLGLAQSLRPSASRLKSSFFQALSDPLTSTTTKLCPSHKAITAHVGYRAHHFSDPFPTDIDRPTTSPTAISPILATFEVEATGETSLRFSWAVGQDRRCRSSSISIRTLRLLISI